MTAALVVLGGYLLGSMPFGYWLVRLAKGEDIRNVGSGNIGATNVWRTYGKTYGIPIVLLDVAKGFVPGLVGTLLVGELVGVLAGGAAVFLVFRYASLASITAAVALPFVGLALGQPWPVIVFAALAAVAVIALHRANIARLRAGTESRFRLRRA